MYLPIAELVSKLVFIEILVHHGYTKYIPADNESLNSSYLHTDMRRL